MRTTRRERDTADRLLYELEKYGGLEVVLIPAPDPKHAGHKIRARQSQNAPWFRKFTAEFMACYGRSRKARPNFIKKARVITALEKIVGDRADGVYCDRLLAYIRRELRREDRNRRIEKQIARGKYEYIPF